MKYDYLVGTLSDWQFYWTWDWRPWAHLYPADEDGPAELWGGIGPIQFKFTMWGYVK